MKYTQKVLYGIAGFAAVAALAAAPLALAQSTPGQAPRSANVSVNIGQNGKVEVHGASVTAVASSTGFTATTVWGSTTLTWNVKVNAATEYTDKDGKKGDARHKAVDFSHIVVGDTVDWNGQLDTTASVLTVTARVINDKSAVVLPLAHVKDVFQGKLPGTIATSSLPTSFTLMIGKDSYTVNVPTGAQIINSNFAPIALSTFQSGDTVRVFGSLNSSGTIDALIVRDASR